LTKKHEAALQQLIGNVPLTLLYRGTRDGINAAAFRERCQNKGPTFFVVKTTKNFIAGAYTPLPWTEWNISNKYKDDLTKTSFIYSLEDGSGEVNPVKYLQDSPSFSIRDLTNGDAQWGFSEFRIKFPTAVYSVPSNPSAATTTYSYKIPSNTALLGEALATISEIEVFSIPAVPR